MYVWCTANSVLDIIRMSVVSVVKSHRQRKKSGSTDGGKSDVHEAAPAEMNAKFSGVVVLHVNVVMKALP